MLLCGADYGGCRSSNTVRVLGSRMLQRHTNIIDSHRLEETHRVNHVQLLQLVEQMLRKFLRRKTVVTSLERLKSERLLLLDCS